MSWGGCFWCLDAAYKLIKGVVKVEQGYSGGAVTVVDDYQVSAGIAGQAEVVQLTFNPKIISLTDILDIFWMIHDPTTLNRQGYDVGPQYRSIILYMNEDQKNLIELSLNKAKKIWAIKLLRKLNRLSSSIRPVNIKKITKKTARIIAS